VEKPRFARRTGFVGVVGGPDPIGHGVGDLFQLHAREVEDHVKFSGCQARDVSRA
jgi:hypothetical protein